MGDFFYKITDDSMSDFRIECGDIVKIRETDAVVLGDIVAFICEGDISKLTLGRVDGQNRIKRDDALMIGKVTRLIKSQ
jgi:SOS-response transcriptional repressor LexA